MAVCESCRSDIIEDAAMRCRRLLPRMRAMSERRGLGQDRRGAAAAEYALVLAIAGAAITFGALALGTAITDSIDEPTECAAATASTSTDC